MIIFKAKHEQVIILYEEKIKYDEQIIRYEEKILNIVDIWLYRINNRKCISWTNGSTSCK